jgi:hypothetical protein
LGGGSGPGVTLFVLPFFAVSPRSGIQIALVFPRGRGNFKQRFVFAGPCLTKYLFMPKSESFKGEEVNAQQ